MKFLKKEIFFILFFFICLYLTFDKHSQTGIDNYHSQLWADPSGYYVYLPATFIYGYHASDFPEGIENKVGNGFTLDQTTNKVRTKYTSGIAILFLPFFLIAHLLAFFLSLDPSGFSPVYYKLIDVAAVFYLTLGIYLLRRFLCYYFPKRICTLTVILLFVATNLYYYSISSTFYSHIYSFFLFSLFLFFFKKYIIERKPGIKHIFLISIIGALIVLIRPTNIVFVLAAFFWDINSFLMFKKRIKLFLYPKSILFVLLAGVIVFLPQSLYWHFITNKFIVYTYGSEGFSNWNSPKIMEVLFSPNNGLIVWTPIFLLIIISLVLTVIRKEKNAILVLIAFCLTLYLCSSWHMWYFGCGFSQRSFVEYLALLSIPVAYGQVYLNQIKKCVIRNIVYLIILFCIYFNLKMIYHYEVCFFGGTWDWKAYSNYFDKSTMFGFTRHYTFINNFDKTNWDPKVDGQHSIVKSKISVSGEGVSKIDSVNIYSSGCMLTMKKIGRRSVKSANVTFQSYVYNSPADFNIVCEIDSSLKPLLFQTYKLSLYSHKIRKWEEIKTTINFIGSFNKLNTFKLYLMNNGKDSMLIDNLKIVFTY